MMAGARHVLMTRTQPFAQCSTQAPATLRKKEKGGAEKQSTQYYPFRVEESKNQKLKERIQLRQLDVCHKIWKELASGQILYWPGWASVTRAISVGVCLGDWVSIPNSMSVHAIDIRLPPV